MKRLIILSCLIFGSAMSAKAIDVVMPPIVNGLQNTDSQMRLIEQQRFRQEEYNEFKDMKQQKEERNKEIDLEEKFNEQQKQTQKYTPEVNLIRENGQLKLKPVIAE